MIRCSLEEGMTSPFLLFSLLLLFSPNRLSLSVRTPLGLVFEDCPIIISHPEFLRPIPHPDSLCDVLGLDFENGCFFSCDSELRVPARRLTGREISGDEGRRPVSVELHRMMGRKFLSELTANASVGGEGDEKLDRTFPVLPVNMAISIPGMLLLCCFVICPCFRAKAREEEDDHAVLPNGSGSKHSTSSFEVSKTSERTPASPHWFPPTPNRFFKSSERNPGSPHRVPPSPSYVAPSQSRFSMSQQLNKVDPIHLNVNQVIKATHNFSPSLKIGGGGFGAVYKAELPDGRIVAIKRAKKAFETFNNGNVGDILDPRLEEAVDTKVLSRLLDLAFQCAAPTRPDRPVMQEVGARLWEIRKEYGFSLRRE
ncbi:Calmodulin-binding receptor-like cytoplasmic kinase 3 [Acorus calamus]|uniref:Calmodulin-binding receptor-like cytoplasmic kinase 3 n=1 Tax=Acorus calamus TaxID=4465 RepID=A0AAV9EWM7_ACOCL|nr:Calmodulin-binding receptor-like cytoplasmic kinase 3 [Acorus calamus]